MQCHELIELSALIAVNARAFIQGRGRLPDRNISAYWSWSRVRFDGWARALRNDWRKLRSGQPVSSVWRHARPVLEEILTGELLVRVWTAVACALDRQAGSSYVSPVVRSVFLGHLEARHRALRFMFHAQEHIPVSVLAVNRIRHRSERWTDMLLSYLPPGDEIALVAFDPRRVADFGQDACGLLQPPDVERSWQLLRLSLRRSFAHSLSGIAPHGNLNAQIGASILACLWRGLSDATGALDLLWRERLESTTVAAEAWIEELLAEDFLEDSQTVQ